MSETKLDLGLEYAAEQAPMLVRRDGRLTEWLNSKAVDGWRLVAVDAGYYYFERKAHEIKKAQDYSNLAARNPVRV